MRDRIERFVFLPFNVGCISESSIAVGMQQAKRSNLDANSTPTSENLKNPLSLLALPKFQKLFKNFKNFSQLFVYKDEFEEAEMGMEIGLPTDVKHVTHIGLDGCASSILSKGWNNINEAAFVDLPPLPNTS
ncbi:hypothetical protein BUALT_Bualt01G0115600 [Buddleja alternifolia]|uniref:CRIB domain-containing protein n=1 Tax=Buddleja alternifolia TaxID=168488 RepID=A0AAV6Y6D5_9LAMI|nr:hypothetical protein BUALT_Bualt01G0115600 [Buddleja alternifolia]